MAGTHVVRRLEILHHKNTSKNPCAHHAGAFVVKRKPPALSGGSKKLIQTNVFRDQRQMRLDRVCLKATGSTNGGKRHQCQHSQGHESKAHQRHFALEHSDLITHGTILAAAIVTDGMEVEHHIQEECRCKNDTECQSGNAMLVEPFLHAEDLLS